MHIKGATNTVVRGSILSRKAVVPRRGIKSMSIKICDANLNWRMGSNSEHGPARKISNGFMTHSNNKNI